MKTWHRLDLEDALMAQPRLEDVRAAYAAPAQAGENRPSGAVFARYDSPGSLHCTVTLFFTPEATALARRCGAQPCEQPPHRNLELLAGAAENLSGS
ncbi:hypothetical protein [Elongatibacter sediminis]|uniref:Uncharacterized protein n=1 Tax=Elongatibacter sediminis TaxID=3119006 RepID=A0AAW9RFW6_9GAMM